MPEVVEVPPFSPAAIEALESVVGNFKVEYAQEVKRIEATTNHDVKAVEYFLKDKFGSNEEISRVGAGCGYQLCSGRVSPRNDCKQLRAERRDKPSGVECSKLKAGGSLTL